MAANLSLEGRVVVSPLAEMRALLPELPDADCVIFTSQNAVRALGGRVPARRAWCVGDRTAEVAAAAGFDARSASGDADALVTAMIAGERGRCLHLRGRVATGDVAARLNAAGIPCAEAVVYEMRDLPPTPEALALLRGDVPVIVPLFSPAGARRVAAIPATAPLRLACLSPAVAAAAPEGEVRIAAEPNARAMQNLVAAMQRLETSAPQS